MSTTTATILLLSLSLILIILPILSTQLPRCFTTTTTNNAQVRQHTRRTRPRQRPQTDGTNSRETSEDNATPYQDVSEAQEKQEGIKKRRTATMGKKPWDPPFPKRVGTTVMQKQKTVDVNQDSNPNTDQDVAPDLEKDAEQEQTERARQSSLPSASNTSNGPAKRDSYLILPPTTAAVPSVVPSLPISRKSTEVLGGGGGGGGGGGRTGTDLGTRRTGTIGSIVERGRTMSRRGIDVDGELDTSVEPTMKNDPEPNDANNDNDNDNDDSSNESSPSSTPQPQPSSPAKPCSYYLTLLLATLATLLFLLAFAILIAHILAWFLVYKTEARLGEARRGVLKGGDMRLCLCS